MFIFINTNNDITKNIRYPDFTNLIYQFPKSSSASYQSNYDGWLCGAIKMTSNNSVAVLMINSERVIMGNTAANGATNSTCFPVCIPIRKNDTISFGYASTDEWLPFLYLYGTL